jgi:hypothetical protein
VEEDIDDDDDDDDDVHLVGFILRICHDVRSHERKIYQKSVHKYGTRTIVWVYP